MTITLIFLGVIMAVVVGWLLKQSFNTQPWVADGVEMEPADSSGVTSSPKKFALVAFLAVATSLFALFVSAYAIRMQLADWTPLAEPQLLWVNTGLLILASIALQWGVRSASSGSFAQVRFAINGAGITSLAFLLGQLFAWQQLVAAGMYLQSNPANAFFYLFTALHGLHLLGGLWVLTRAAVTVWRNEFDSSAVRQTVELCAIYWHFLLAVWLGLFWLMLST